MNAFIAQFKAIKLNLYDKFFLFGCGVTFLVLMVNGMTILTLGGLFLIIGAFLTYKGQILISIAMYLIADVCWIVNAWQVDDIQGTIFIIIGITFGTASTWKMMSGQMEKDLIKRKD